MADVPVKNSRRWQDFKFRYTADDGSEHITSQRISKDENGDPFLPVTALLAARKIVDTKTKLWGKPENLRKIVITYAESRNTTGTGEVVRYSPYQPTTENLNYLIEIREACKAKFGEYQYCTDYYGENRFTFDRPQRINDSR